MEVASFLLYLPYETSDNHSALLAAALYASAQEATLPTPDAKALGMGGVAMTTLSGSHAIYNNSATAIFSQMPSQVSSSYYGQGEFDYYAVTGFCRFDNVNMAQIGWRQYLRERGNNDMAVDLGYSRRLGERWAVGIVGRYMHLKRHDDTADALAVDLSVAWSQPLENVGSHSTLRVGGKLGNLGGYLGKTDYTLPMDLTAGVALDTFLTDAHRNNRRGGLGLLFLPGAGARVPDVGGRRIQPHAAHPAAGGLPLRRTAELLPHLRVGRRPACGSCTCASISPT